MRGLVMVLMTTDHASKVFFERHLVSDSAFLYEPGTLIDAGAFLHRWLSHLCAPTFLFLAGIGLSLSIEKQQRRMSAGAIDRFLLVRGLILIACDLTLISALWSFPGTILFLQVLYAIGVSMIAMIPLRRAPTAALCTLGLLILVGSEAIAGLIVFGIGGPSAVEGAMPRASTLVTMLLTGGRASQIATMVGYPAIPWLGMMILGFSAGRVVRDDRQAASFFARAGVGALAIYAVVRGVNGYGNFALLREDHSLVQWLHVSKYPPSVAFSALELGVMAIVLAVFFGIRSGAAHPPSERNPLLVFGQVPLFFYLLHIPLLELAGALTRARSDNLGLTYAAVVGVLGLLYPICRAYRDYKRAHPAGWTRYI
jgi:uncharacterized membrane protein